MVPIALATNGGSGAARSGGEKQRAAATHVTTIRVRPTCRRRVPERAAPRTRACHSGSRRRVPTQGQQSVRVHDVLFVLLLHRHKAEVRNSALTLTQAARFIRCTGFAN